MRTLSEYAPPPNGAFNQRMQVAIAQESAEFAAYDADHIVATQFAARFGAPDAALHIERANTVPNCKYTVKSGAPIGKDRQIGPPAH